MSLLRRTPKLSKKKPRKPAAENDDDPFDALTDNESNKTTVHKDKNTELRKSKQQQTKKTKKQQQQQLVKDNENNTSVTEEGGHAVDPVFEVINEVLCNHYNVDVDTISEISSTSDYSYNRLEDTSEFSSKDSLFHDSNTSTPPQTTRRVKRISSVPNAEASDAAPQPKKANSLSRKSSTARFFKGIFKKNKSESNNNVVVSEPDFPDINPREQRSNSEATVVKLRRKSVSLRRRLSSLLSESAGPVTRSTSIRDFTKKSKSENVNLWSTSLQSLVENDIAVSYHDLSLINYDVLNTCSYEEDDTEPAPSVGRQLCRSQSVSVQNVCETQQVIAKNNRHSVPCEVLDRYYYKSSLNLTCTSEAASLPTLHQLEGGNNNVSSPGTVHRYRRRVGSASTEDTQARFRNGTANSFRSSGCSKLRRTNACRQVKRDPTPTPDRNVRSRSLNHLDTLGQTYHQQHQVDGAGDTVVVTTDTTTTATTTTTCRDHSRSEPDCTMTRPHQERLLTVPATDSPVPGGTTERTGSGGSDRVRTTTRRQMLSRSQVSSSEYFSVSFELGEDSSVVHGREEFLPATKCTSLGEALSKVCERRSIDISNCDIYIDGCRATTPYILNQETSALGGKTIRIAGKEVNSKKTGTVSNQASIHNRKTSGSYRGKSSGLFFSSSTEDASSGVQSGSTPLLLQDTRPDYDQNKKQSKQRWSGFFGNNKDTRMESLSDILNQYSRHGVPNSIHPQSAVVDEEAVQALYSLEEDWRQLMDPSDLTERQQQQQTAIWELISTEVAYIKTLKVVTGLFLACLKSVQTYNILTEIDTDKLFSNITEILDCNMAFWADYVLPAVVQMRTSRQPVTPLAFYDGFVRMCETYRPYFRYCAEQARCQHYCRENHAHNEIFTAYLVWCETQKECNRLRLMDILVRPMQRLTKYGLLLKAIIKNTDNDDEQKGLCTMIKSVDDFVNSVNSSLKQKQDNERLRGIMLRIESYDAVETKDDDIQTMVQKHNHLDLSQPMPGCPPDRKRHLLLEGDLKLKDATSSKMEVHCFLLTDILLICKPSSKKGGALMRVIRPPYLVDRLILQELSRETPSLALVYLNEFKTATAAFILQNNDMKKLKTWVECIRKAQGLYEQAKQTPTLGLMRQLSASVAGDEFLDGDYFDNSLDADTHSLQSLLPARSPLATSSRASRVSSLAHSHSGSVEMNDQSSIGSANNQSRGVSIENENRTASISSDEGVQPLPADNQKNSLKQRLLLSSGSRTLTPNTLSVQPYGNLGQSLPNLTLGSPNVGTLHQNTLLVPSTRNNGQHLLSPNQRGISYPPPSPTRANLRRGFAISQSKNPPLIKTGHVNSTIGGVISSSSTSTPAPITAEPTNFDFDVPVISGISPPDDLTDSFNRGHHRQAMMKRVYHRSDNRRYHTAGVVDDIKKNNERDTASILKRLSWNCGPSEQLTTSQHPPPPPPPLEDHHTDT